jgi:PAS domain-containing protein
MVMNGNHEIDINLLKTVTDNMGDLVWMTDLELKYLYISPSIEWLLGYKPNDAKAMFGDNTTTNESLQRIASAIIEGYNAAEHNILSWYKIIDVEMVSSSGNKIKGVMKIFLKKDKFEKHSGFIGIIHLITGNCFGNSV